jgi:hypothetical protein
MRDFRFWRDRRGFVRGSGSRGAGRCSRALRPVLEPCEGRRMLSASGGLAHLAVVDHAASAVAVANALKKYRVFEGTITRGPAAGLTVSGPLLLAYVDRIQVFGYVFEPSGTRVAVVGTVYAGAANLRLVIPTKTGSIALEAAGTGQLVNVKGGIPGEQALVGLGNLSGPNFKTDFGRWETLAPSKVTTI